MSIGESRYGIIGCNNITTATEFLALFDLLPIGEMTLSAEVADTLYGLKDSIRVRVLATPGVPGRGVRLVPTPYKRPQLKPDSVCGYAIDIYTRDMHASLHAATKAGYRISSTASYELGPVTFVEARVFGPDGLSVVLIETVARRPSRLDQKETHLHSEVQAFVFCIADATPDLTFWPDVAGLDVMRSERMTIGEPLASLLELPMETKMGLDLFWHEESASARVELLSFPGRNSKGEIAARPLQSGLAAVTFIASIDDTQKILSSAQLQKPVSLPTGGQVIAARSPAGIPFELWIP